MKMNQTNVPMEKNKLILHLVETRDIYGKISQPID
jgi:hypothetical protein